ncbi:MAG: hypothetical protein ACI9W2_005050 [Gammaproteobacteria bacterium]|jgi:hypothetical protein
MCFLDHFESLKDPRSMINRRHDLLDIVFFTVSAVLSGAQGWKDIKNFGDVKFAWLRRYRAFEHGIPANTAFPPMTRLPESSVRRHRGR